MNQIMCKVAPALAAGCTMVLKPSEIAPLSGILAAEVLHEAGVPRGVFNLVNGEGPVVGAAMSAHPGIDMMSFTGSTRAGTQVAKAAADTREARRAGAGRQVGQHHSRRCGFRAEREGRRAVLLQQQRPVVQCADAHAGAARAARRSRRDCQGRGTRRSWSAIRARTARPSGRS